MINKTGKKYSKSAIHAIVPAAGTAKNMVLAHAHLPDAMTPINGKPVIGYILDDLLERRIRSISIIVNKSDQHTEKYVTRKYHSRCDINFVYNEKPERGVGHSVILGLPSTRVGAILVYLGDTIYKGPLRFSNDFLVTAPFKTEPAKWCFVEQKNRKLVFIDRPEMKPAAAGIILAGLYYFKNGTALFHIGQVLKKKLRKIEMSDLLAQYQHQYQFNMVSASRWYDCGNLDNFYKAKIDFLKLRNFNQIKYDDLRGTITKMSPGNNKKVLNELAWYHALPNDLKIFTPRILKYNASETNASYTMEYYGYQSLADLYVFETLDQSLWPGVISKLFDILNEFEQHASGHTVRRSDMHSMLIGKLRERLFLMEKQYWFRRLANKEHITVNGRVLKNLPLLHSKLVETAEVFADSARPGIVHGDFCLSNILFDPGSKLIKIIDPRGSFGRSRMIGDLRYDVAKLRHSFCGYYDFIVNDFFDVKETASNQYHFELFTDPYNTTIAQYFDQEVEKHSYHASEVKFIESLLFLSMIPLHSDNKNRQLAMYLTGVQMLNELDL